MRAMRSIVLALLLGSCSKTKQPEAPPHVSAAFFGKTVALPGALAKLRFGMTHAEAHALFPEIPTVIAGAMDQYPVDIGLADSKGWVMFEGDAISIISVQIPIRDDIALPDKLPAEAWGPPTRDKYNMQTWTSADGTLIAKVTGDSVAFTPKGQ